MLNKLDVACSMLRRQIYSYSFFDLVSKNPPVLLRTCLITVGVVMSTEFHE